jgi:ACR3 family arsenite transporter
MTVDEKPVGEETPSQKPSPQINPEDTEKQQHDGDEQVERKESAFKSLGWLDRFLALWILLAMILGIVLGNFTHTGDALRKGEFVKVSLPIAIGLLVMMYPILCKVRYESLHELLRTKALWKQIIFSVIINWIIAPFFMVSLLVVISHHHGSKINAQ